MDMEFVEKVWNYPAPIHHIYKDPSSGLYGVCLHTEGDVPVLDDAIPMCSTLEQMHAAIERYDKWLGEGTGETCDYDFYDFDGEL